MREANALMPRTLLARSSRADQPQRFLRVSTQQLTTLAERAAAKPLALVGQLRQLARPPTSPTPPSVAHQVPPPRTTSPPRLPALSR
jgi:hypothetical protein